MSNGFSTFAVQFIIRILSFFSHYGFVIRHFLCLLVACGLGARAADTNSNSLVWNKAAGRVDADIHGEALWPLLEDIAHQTGWHIFVEPGTARNASTKFKDLPPDDALRMLLGNLNFAFVPQTNGPDFLYVFTTSRANATRHVGAANAPPRRVANELLVKLKPGTDIDALAKLLGAKITGRNDKLGIYRLLFDNADSTDAALGKLKSDSRRRRRGLQLHLRHAADSAAARQSAGRAGFADAESAGRFGQDHCRFD